MTLKRKPDASRIRNFLPSLKNREWITPAQRQWPDFLFHIAPLPNAISILQKGVLYSRSEAQKLVVMQTDSASPGIIEHTDERWKGYARLYFRPRTPTHYQTEGLRSPKQLQYGPQAHCPVPVCFVFLSHSVLSRKDTLFSYGNLARDPEVYSTADDLEGLPFEKVYFDGPFPPEMSQPVRDEITFHRNAEVIVPGQLELSPLQIVGCRSEAELETLLHSLSDQARSKWRKRIGVYPQFNLFENRWTYVDHVDMSSHRIVFHFNPDTESPGPFHARFKMVDPSTFNVLDSWEQRSLRTEGPLELDLTRIDNPPFYEVRLWLDDHLMYANRFHAEELPW